MLSLANLSLSAHMKTFLVILTVFLTCELSLYSDDINSRFTVCEVNEEAAEYIGGTRKMLEEVARSANATSDTTGYSGRVVLQFIVGKDGYVKHETIRVRKSVSESYDSVAINAVKKLGRFKPGRNIHGEIDDTWYTLPVSFGGRACCAVYAEDASQYNDNIFVERAVPPEYKSGTKNLLYDLSVAQVVPQGCEPMTGRVLLSCLVGKDGFIIADSIKVLDSMTPAYDKASIEAVKKLGRFYPGRNWNAEVDDCWLTIPVRWPPRKPGGRVSKAKSPKYLSGVQAMYDEIAKNIQPDVSGSRGRVVVKFLVGKDGYIKHETIEVRHGMSEYYDHAVVEAVKKLGQFKPGKNKHGEIDDTWYTLSVCFGGKQETQDSVPNYMFIDRPRNPEYVGGFGKLNADLLKFQQEPEGCEQKKGRVVLTMYISKEGYIKPETIKVLHSLSPEYDEASIAAVKKLGRFLPGRNLQGEFDDCPYYFPLFWPPRKPGEPISAARGPKYIGNMYDEIAKNIQPDGSGARGRVVAKFLVGKDGYIKHETIEVRHSMSEYYDHAVIEAVKKLGKFEPGRNEKGETADQWYPICVVIGDNRQTEE